MNTNPAVQPKLNYDILFVLMEFCDRGTLSRISQTCFTLRDHSVRLLLKEDVMIHTPKALESLYHFLCPGRPSRIRFLRRLNLNVAGVSVDVALRLAAIFKESSHLEALSMLNAEQLLESHDSIAHSIAELKTLRSLVSWDSDDRTREMLRNLQSPVADLDFTQFADRDEEPTLAEYPNYHPLYLCKNFASTLEALTTKFMNWNYSINPDQGLPIYPDLLTLKLVEDDYPFVGYWIVGCPNVEELIIQTSREWHRDLQCRVPHIESDVRIRRDNLEFQNTHGSWEHLEIFSGSALSLHLANLTCPIPWLKLDHVQAPDLETLKATMSNAKPDRLTLILNGAEALFVNGEHSLATIFRKAGTFIDTLHLEVRPWLDEVEDSVLDLGALAARMLRAAARLPQLERLRIEIEVPDESPRHTMIAVEEFDYDAYIPRALRTIPTLLNVEVHVRCTSNRYLQFTDSEWTSEEETTDETDSDLGSVVSESELSAGTCSDIDDDGTAEMGL